MLKIAEEIVNLMKKSQEQGTKPFDSTAEVIRVEDDRLWVHIPGGVDETPVQKTIAAEVGDMVQVRVSNGSAWVVGNSTAPPTDDALAKQASQKAENNDKKIKQVANDLENKISKIAGNENQYFWHTETGTDTGSHIAEVPKEEFEANPQGFNVLIRSIGIAIRNALTELAQFSGSLVRIGKEDAAHVEITPDSLALMDNQGTEAFSVDSGGETVKKFYTGRSRSSTAAWINHPLTETIQFAHSPLFEEGVKIIVAMDVPDGNPDYHEEEFNFTAVGTQTKTYTATNYTVKTDVTTTATNFTVTITIINVTGASYGFTIHPDYRYEIYYTGINSTVRVSSSPAEIELYNTKTKKITNITAYSNDDNTNDLVVNTGGSVYLGGGDYPEQMYDDQTSGDIKKVNLYGDEINFYIKNEITGKIERVGIFENDARGFTTFYANVIQGKNENGDDLGNIGTRVFSTPPDKTIASSTNWTNFGSITLPPGIWIIHNLIRWSANANGVRGCNVSRTSGGLGIDVMASDIVAGGSGSWVYSRVTTILAPTEQTTYYLNGFQNSGSNLTGNPRAVAIRII